jgi:hypothetical protein
MQEDNTNNSKRSDDRKGSTRKNIRFEDALLERIDQNRAATNTSFAEWVKDACIKKLD